jgi:hypothetical protein
MQMKNARATKCSIRKPLCKQKINKK